MLMVSGPSKDCVIVPGWERERGVRQHCWTYTQDKMGQLGRRCRFLLNQGVGRDLTWWWIMRRAGLQFQGLNHA